jgi:hypothetical protein
MDSQPNEVKQIAAQLLSGMLSNPHIYAAMSDEEGEGRLEQSLVTVAIAMAKRLVEKVDQKPG